MHITPQKALVPCHIGLPRSPGIHISGVIKLMAAEYGLLKKEWAEDLSLIETGRNPEVWWASLDAASQIRMGLGLAWEQWYLPQIEGVCHQPGEMCVEGIYMTHDGEGLSTIVSEENELRYCLACHEVKLTYKSTRTVGDFSEQWMWLMQIKAYCKALRTRLAFAHVCFVCGDYGYPITPQLKVWRIEFTQAEIDEAWELTKGYIVYYQQLERERQIADSLEP